MSSDVISLVDKATSALLLDIDWDTTLQIVDLIRQGDITPKNAISALLTKIHDSNPNVVILALQVTESVVKNCGQAVHEHIATRDFMVEIRDLLKKSTNEEVQKRIMLLLAAWVYAFRSEPKYKAVQDTVNILKAEGYKIPTVIESDAMFTADTAPDWADGECCHRCRSQFSILRRKHHCRACGQVFCSNCSNKNSTIPKFGIERDVRVCDYCFEDINNAQRLSGAGKNDTPSASDKPTSKPTTATGPPKKSAEELQEEEELQLALALSKSEAENKEKEKLRATSDLLGAGWRQQHQPSIISAPPKTALPHIVDRGEEGDPELAKYLNRPFWEQQRQKQKVKDIDPEVSVPSFSPTIPSAPLNSSKIIMPLKSNEYFQNAGMEEVDDFVTTLRGQLEIFVNRMKSNQSRGRPIANDTAVQSLFMNITAMHSQLLTYIQDQDRKRVHCEQLQDKISQIRDARAALDSLREEHKDKLRREKEEQDRIRQIQMMQKLEIMRKKKQEYLEYQRQLALHRMAESERQILSGQPGFPPPVGYPPQGYPPQAQMGGYMYPIPPGENALPGMMPPPYQQGPPPPSVRPTGQPIPYAGPHAHPHSGPPNPEYGHFSMQGPSPNMNIPPGYAPPHGPPMTSPPSGPAPQPQGLPPPEMIQPHHPSQQLHHQPQQLQHQPQQLQHQPQQLQHQPQQLQPHQLQHQPQQHQPIQPPQPIQQQQQQPEDQTQLISFD